MIAPALGVPLRFYQPFAEFLAENGVATRIADCRGATLTDWVERDLPAALAELPDVPVAWIGHSMGGQLFGAMRETPRVDRALFVAAQHGHWRNWHGWPRYAMAAFFWAAVPALTAATGRLPMRPIGGQDVPAPIARQWASWGRSRDYILGFARGRGACNFDRYRGRLRAYAIADDRYAPASTVRPLVAAFTAADTEVREVTASGYGSRHLGHFGPFRPSARPLWEEWLGWLIDP